MNSSQYKQKIMERKLTKKELMVEMFPQTPTKSDDEEGKVEDKNEVESLLDETEIDECDVENMNDLKEARERIYGTSQATEMKRLYRLFNKLNN